MKVLYIGHYRDGTGWGNAALNNILAMQEAGIDVVPRAITYESEDKTTDLRIENLEMKSSNNCDVVVQHTLPHNYVYNADYKNIGFLAVESSNFKDTGWQHNCNLMDEMWVPSEAARKALIWSGVTVPVKIVPHSLRMRDYSEITNKNPIDTLQNQFVFGFVGEFIERKNVKALVRAFHMEFQPEEPVSLLIKTSKANLEDVQKYLAHIRKGLRIRKNYKEEVVAAGMATNEEYLDLLSQIDCFVMPSRGEAFCIPSLEAMAMGIPCIWTNGIGLDHTLGIAVESHDEPCFGAVETLDGLDTSNSNWKEISVKCLGSSMRKMYDTLIVPEMKQDVAKQCKERAANYSHKEIGKIIKRILNDS